MIAFTATADPEAPHNALDIDTDELVAAHWFPRDAVALAATVEGDAVMNADVAARVGGRRRERRRRRALGAAQRAAVPRV